MQIQSWNPSDHQIADPDEVIRPTLTLGWPDKIRIRWATAPSLPFPNQLLPCNWRLLPLHKQKPPASLAYNCNTTGGTRGGHTLHIVLGKKISPHVTMHCKRIWSENISGINHHNWANQPNRYRRASIKILNDMMTATQTNEHWHPSSNSIRVNRQIYLGSRVQAEKPCQQKRHDEAKHGDHI